MTDIIMSQQAASPVVAKQKHRKMAKAESSAAGAAAAMTPVKPKALIRVAGDKAGAPSPAKRRRDRAMRRKELGDVPVSVVPKAVKSKKPKGAASGAAYGVFEKDPKVRAWNTANVAQAVVAKLPVVWSKDGQ